MSTSGLRGLSVLTSEIREFSLFRATKLKIPHIDTLGDIGDLITESVSESSIGGNLGSIYNKLLRIQNADLCII